MRYYLTEINLYAAVGLFLRFVSSTVLVILFIVFKARGGIVPITKLRYAPHICLYLWTKPEIRDVSDQYRSLFNVKFSTRLTLTLLFYSFWFVMADECFSNTLITSSLYINSVARLGECFGRLVALPHSPLIRDLLKPYSFTVPRFGLN